MANPEPLAAEKLTRPGNGLAHQVIVKDFTGSTNDDARALAEMGAAHGVVVIAERQEAGRGRKGRVWHSPAFVNLLFSLILRLRRTAEGPGLIPLAAGVAVAEAVRELCAVPAQVKWPNDVRVKGRKLAGILAEAGGKGHLEYVILGVGLNVNMERGELPPELKPSATSLFMETGRRWPREEVFRRLMERLEKELLLLESGGGSGVLCRWEKLAETRGRKVRVETPGGVMVGEAAGVREDGALIILPEGGEENVAVLAGDVILLEDG